MFRAHYSSVTGEYKCVLQRWTQSSSEHNTVPSARHQISHVRLDIKLLNLRININMSPFWIHLCFAENKLTTTFESAESVFLLWICTKSKRHQSLKHAGYLSSRSIIIYWENCSQDSNEQVSNMRINRNTISNSMNSLECWRAAPVINTCL